MTTVRRIPSFGSTSAAAVGGREVLFSRPTLTADRSGPWTNLRPAEIVEVAVALGTAGTTTTTVQIEVNLTTVATCNLGAGVLVVIVPVSVALAVADRITANLTAVGSGAAGLVVQVRLS